MTVEEWAAVDQALEVLEKHFLNKCSDAEMQRKELRLLGVQPEENILRVVRDIHRQSARTVADLRKMYLRESEE